MVDPISEEVADLVSSMLPCLQQPAAAGGETITCFENIYWECNKAPPPNRIGSNCAVDLSRGIGEVCSRLVYDYEQFSNTSTCIYAFLNYTATLANNSSFYRHIFSLAVQSYLRNCLKSNSTNKVDCVIDSITSCLEQRQSRRISVGTCFMLPYCICSMIKNVGYDDCVLYVNNIVNDYSRDLCTDHIDLCVSILGVH